MRDIPGWLKHATVWLVLGACVFVAVRTIQQRQQATRFVVVGGTLQIERGPDGHYHWPGSINGRDVPFLIDTGATGTAIPSALAEELGLAAQGEVQSSTAGGVVSGVRVVADLALQGGVRVDRLRIVALPGLEAPLLGMDVLGRLRWRQEGGVLRIELHPPGH